MFYTAWDSYKAIIAESPALPLRPEYPEYPGRQLRLSSLLELPSCQTQVLFLGFGSSVVSFDFPFTRVPVLSYPKPAFSALEAGLDESMTPALIERITELADGYARHPPFRRSR